MCGIIAYCGKRDVLPILIDGLKRLEYRGYDSAGFSIIDENKKNIVVKEVGKVSELEKKKAKLKVKSTFGIAHTRWATHGKPTEINAHPHVDCNGKISVVHNGIIENYLELKDELIKKGHEFKSDTDTEVIAHLIEENFEDDLELAVLKSVERLIGTF